MSEPGLKYPFSSGERLESRNTYFYTPYGGEPFLDAWRRVRDDLLAALPPPARGAPKADLAPPLGDEQAWFTAGLLEYIYASVLESGPHQDADHARLLEQLIRKFETSKRIHGAYRRSDFRAIEPGDYRDGALYLRAAEIFEATFASGKLLQGLNALLKIIDTLTGFAPPFKAVDGARLARLVIAEREHVDSLMRDMRPS